MPGFAVLRARNPNPGGGRVPRREARISETRRLINKTAPYRKKLQGTVVSSCPLGANAYKVKSMNAKAAKERKGKAKEIKAETQRTQGTQRKNEGKI